MVRNTPDHHEEFLILLKSEGIPFFKKWFSEAVEGKFPKKFSYYNGELTYTKKRNQVYRTKFLPEDAESVRELKKFIATHSKFNVTKTNQRIKIIKTKEQINDETKKLFNSNQLFRKELLRTYFTELSDDVIDKLNTLFIINKINVDNFIFDNHQIANVSCITINKNGCVHIRAKKNRTKQVDLFGDYADWVYQTDKPKIDFNFQLKKFLGNACKEDTPDVKFFPQNEISTSTN